MPRHALPFLSSLTALGVNKIRSLTNRGLPLAALLFAVLLLPAIGRASTSNCPSEPIQTGIVTGEVYAGSNCNLYTDGDIDGFTFTGIKGYTYQIAAALNGVTSNICVELSDPSLNLVAGPSCTTVGYYDGSYAAGFDYTPTVTGTYTIDIYELSSGKQNYAVSLEQLHPFPSYATQIPKLGESISGDIAPITDANLFTLNSVASTGEYLWTVTLPTNPSSNICLWVYLSNGAAASGSPACTTVGYYDGSGTAQIEVSKPASGANTAVVEVEGNDGTQSYSFEVSCVAGNCPTPPPPPCTLNDTLSYNSSTDTLTMNFEVGTDTAGTWNAWLTYQNTFEDLFSVARKVTVPPVSITKTKTGLGKEGTVGVLSTLTTPTEGITCSSWQTINTGTP